MKITIITGAQGTGKSREALKLAGIKNTVITTFLAGVKEADEKTESIIFDGFVFPIEPTAELLQVLKGEAISFRPPYATKHISIHPRVIFTCQALPQWTAEHENVEIINL